MDGHVGDDFPHDVPDDVPDVDVPDVPDVPDADLPGIGDPVWHHDAVDLDDDAGADLDTEATSETVDLTADDYSTDVPDIPADVPDAPDGPDDDVPVVGDDSPVGLGADPDVPLADSDSDWLDLPDLADVEIPEPAGGPPWVDTGLLGDADAPGDSVPATPEGGADDLRASLGEPPSVGDPTDDAYQELVGSDDPAVRNLARLWGPPA